METSPSEIRHGVPSQKAQSWGVVISIVVIVLMVVIGAVYVWEKRIAQDAQYRYNPATDDSNL